MDRSDDDKTPPLDVNLARKQHSEYLNALRRAMLLLPSDDDDGKDDHTNTTTAAQQPLEEANEVLCLPALEECPDSVFVEDTVVAPVGTNTVVLTRPGHVTRRGEVDSIKQALMEKMPFLNLVDMRLEETSKNATCDGGDVLDFGNKYLFVGRSSRTNEDGVDVLERTFQNDRMVIPLDLPPSTTTTKALHLKSITTKLDDETLLLPTGNVGDYLLAHLERAIPSPFKIDIVRLPNMLACNVVSIIDNNNKENDDGNNMNKHVLAQDGGCTESRRILQQACDERHITIHWLGGTTEIAKVDGALTCPSILLQ